MISLNQGLFTVQYDTFYIRFLENGFVTNFHISMIRLLVKKYFKKYGQYYFHVFPYKIFTKKSLGVRMGKGKGAFYCWKAEVKPGEVLIDFSGLPVSLAEKLFSEINSKIGIRCELVSFKRADR